MIRYTVGQRKGLGISFGKPMYVIALRPQTNEVVLGEAEDVFKDCLYATDLNFMMIPDLTTSMQVKGKIRYSHTPASCTIRKIKEDTLECIFDEPQRAITPDNRLYFMTEITFLVEVLLNKKSESISRIWILTPIFYSSIFK